MGYWPLETPKCNSQRRGMFSPSSRLPMSYQQRLTTTLRSFGSSFESQGGWQSEHGWGYNGHLLAWGQAAVRLERRVCVLLQGQDFRTVQCGREEEGDPLRTPGSEGRSWW